MPSMNRVLVTIAPAIEAFTSTYCPARSAANAISSSVRLPSVALSRPPIMSPVRAATASVARLSSAASGTIAKTDTTKSSVCASGLTASSTRTTGTRTSSHSSGVLRILFSKGMRFPPAYIPAASLLANFLPSLTWINGLPLWQACAQAESGCDHGQGTAGGLQRRRHRHHHHHHGAGAEAAARLGLGDAQDR